MPERPLDDLLDQAIDALLTRASVESYGSGLDALVRTAGALREMPAQDFKARLKSELQRRTSMSPAPVVQVREGFRTVTPYISVPEGARLIEFLKHTFGAEELGRSPSSAGFHSEIRIGDSMVMIGSGESLRGRERLGAFHVYVPDCDAAYQRAVEAGAKSMGEPADRPYGERSGFVQDFAGNQWYLATRFASNIAPEGLGTVVPFLYPGTAKAVKRAFNAQEMGVYEESGRVVHAAVRIGDAVLEMGEPHGEGPSLPSRFFLYVEDCDAWYRRAVAAGATSIEAPTDQPYGRTATLLDPFGYEWIPASLLKNATR
jgi:PhnB protein